MRGKKREERWRKVEWKSSGRTEINREKQVRGASIECGEVERRRSRSERAGTPQRRQRVRR